MDATAIPRQSTTTAGQSVFRKYASALIQLPGVHSVGWRLATPDSVFVRYYDEGFRALGENVVRDAVGGAKLVSQIIDLDAPQHFDAELRAADAPGRPHSSVAPRDARRGASGIPFHERASHMIRAVAGMRGVWDYSIGKSDVLFSTVAAPFDQYYRELIQPKLGDFTVTFQNYMPDAPAPPA